MAKVTARDANGNEVHVLQVQFNNRGEVESFLTQLVDGHQKWVHASDYNVTVEEGEPVDQPGIMTKDTQLKQDQVAIKGAEVSPPVDPVNPAAGVQDDTTPPPAGNDDETIDDGIISTGDLNGPKPDGPILSDLDDELQPPAEPPVTPPAEPVTPPAAPAAPTTPAPAKPTPPKPSRPAAK